MNTIITKISTGLKCLLDLSIEYLKYFLGYFLESDTKPNMDDDKDLEEDFLEKEFVIV